MTRDVSKGASRVYDSSSMVKLMRESMLLTIGVVVREQSLPQR